ncbi:MAG: cation:proton antiporter [Candidatus Blackburnbacteria bacterium]|nr:cation:proton antiporter [Candidatus Blackburnbacteria bacterium]
MGDASSLFLELAAVLGVAAVIGYAVKTLRLPLIVAYLLTGVLFSVWRVFDLSSSSLMVFPEIGIAFVLFLIGMEMDWKEIKNLGKPIIVSALVQILLSSITGFGVASLLGFTQAESLFLGFGLAFSSTIVVVKLLLEKKDLSSLYGKLSIGILLLEDLAAIIILMVLTVGNSVLNSGLTQAFPVLAIFLKSTGLLATALFLSKYVLKRIFKVVADSPELLFLVSLAWCFIFVSISVLLGFSVVIGAFLAGLALANSPFYWEIQGKVKPLRDFFVMLFFVYLGSQVVFQDIALALPLIIIFTLYAILIKPLIFSFILGAFGFRKHTIFQTSLNLSQISEFSLIIMVIGLKLGVVSQEAVTAIALAAVISIMVSSVMITSSRNLYKKFASFISIFERGKFIHQIEMKKDGALSKDHVVLIGAHRMGGEIIRFLRRERVALVVLDFNPRVIQNLTNEHITAMYGDLGDPETLEFLNLEKARIIISTAPSLDDNLILLNEAKRRKARAPILTRASSVSDAKTLYEAGSDYVIVPEVVSGEFVMEALRNHWTDLGFFRGRSQLELNKLFRNRFAIE